MRVVVVGNGTIGSRHAAYLREAGHEVVTVDPAGGADHNRTSRVPDPARVNAWIIATPTAAHLPVLGEILERRPDARVLLEKPACYPTEIADLVRLVRRHPRARTVVNDIYGHSGAVRRFADSVRLHSGADPIKKVTVEFTKNRELDVVNGRFVDTQYGEAGYEYFHMLSLIRSILPADLYGKYLRTVPASVTPEMRVRTAAENLPEIELYASSTGVIGHPGLAGFAFSAPAAKRQITRSLIPYGENLRYRFADVELVSGKHVTLVFEVHYGTDAEYKNKHAVHIRDARSWRHFLISGNHFKEALLLQLDLLDRAAEGTALLRLPEHRFLAGLGWATSTVLCHAL
ncbi:putative dehydrogenase [Actinomadura pelletieri DSM 43383]|uniref:Putative dehydrogenase n=1 Tax=Actinomadura pelletieri DSM 43383 TaxID=1120940 RepID=A0A495QMB6_9ACTN|nr:Gfo/Idh/MocA family oxidoreductase [Actinomadura pelletieri]RKS73676.1 putative dehydrogenase [Actinomadura pelletieri DSM 43383]